MSYYFKIATIKLRHKGGNVLSYNLRPLSDQKLEVLNEQIRDSTTQGVPVTEPRKNTTSSAPGPSAKSSVTDLTQQIGNIDMRSSDNAEPGVILEAGREVRAKIFLGRVFLGWFWFIPIFHMPPPPNKAPENASERRREPTHVTLSRKEVDFPVGAGAALVDVDISLEWVPQTSTAVPGPPRFHESSESLDESTTADTALVAALQVAVSGGPPGEAAEAVKAAKES